MGSLNHIAAQMRKTAINSPRLASTADIAPYRRSLTGGLRLVLFLDVHQTWHLSLYRPNTWPSAKELEIVRRDFDVPKHANLTRQNIHGWYIIRLKWVEEEQKPLFEVVPANGCGDDYYTQDI